MLSVLYSYFLTVALTNFPESSVGKESACSGGVSRDTGSTLGLEDPLEKSPATHCSPLAWRIPWREAWRAAVHRVAESRTRLSAAQANTRFLSHSQQMRH